MDMSREKMTDPDEGASIRLRYSTQLQSGGRTHMIDAESAIPLGASQELREQIIRETELGVEQLVRQITQHSSQPSVQSPSRVGPGASGSFTVPMTARPGAPVPSQQNESDSRRQPASGLSVTPPAPARAPLPVGESMPTTPAAGGEKSIRLADFMQAINKHLNLSPKEAMELLNVKTLDGLNYLKVFKQLQEIVRQQKNPVSADRVPVNPAQTAHVTGSQRPIERGNLPPSISRSLDDHEQDPSLGGMQNRSTARTAPRTVSSTVPVPTKREMNTVSSVDTERRMQSSPVPETDFAGSPKSPIPIRLGNVRDVEAHTYKFEEEEDEDLEEEDEDEDEDTEDEEYVLPEGDDQLRVTALARLEKLRGERGTTAASVERLAVLNNVISGQISDAQLQQLISTVWSANNRKKLKAPQVESIISWAKEDFFADEVEAVLALIEEGEI